ncbi:Cupin domain protein [Caloramator mitchellensis]|uniref:Cupin domain protein n=1 Tax=Caloramator mitchellensis TaxID=908809 RepID=A0A0R3JRQ3_CALMK|nr:cupin domain-containing protein [Caloramator mitchellensis]KRQ86171.1 Cupin domain protein [Caloramator mitchellensis]
MYYPYFCPYFFNQTRNSNDYSFTPFISCPCPYLANMSPYDYEFTNEYNPDDMRFDDSRSDYLHPSQDYGLIQLKDYGSKPYVVDIEKATKQNNNFRLALWTGKYLQLTLMSINPGEEIGLELHPDVDQFLSIEDGQGVVMMGDKKDKLDFKANVYADYAILIPAGKWHNLINTGDRPLKLYSIYAPPEHPKGTIHKTKKDAEAAEKEHK